MSEYYTVSGYPQYGANGDSASARTEFTSIQSGFDKLPTLAGSGGYVVRVKSTADGLESVTVGTVMTPTVFGTLAHAAASKTTPVDADEFQANDSAASWIQVRITWANIKATFYAALGALIAAGTGKTTPVGGDSIAISDSAAAGATKTLTFANLTTWLQSLTGTWAHSISGSSASCTGQAATVASVTGATGNIAGSSGSCTGNAATASTSSDALCSAQTLTDVTASRALGSTYTNSTGRPICVMVRTAGTGGLSAVLNSTIYAAQSLSDGVTCVINFIVPNGYSYIINNPGGASLNKWYEYR